MRSRAGEFYNKLGEDWADLKPGMLLVGCQTVQLLQKTVWRTPQSSTQSGHMIQPVHS